MEQQTLNLAESICQSLAELVTLELSVTPEQSLEDMWQNTAKRLTLTVKDGLKYGGVVLKPYFLGGKLQCMAVKPADYRILEADVNTNAPKTVEFYERNGEYVRVERHTQLTNEYVVTNFAMYKGRILENLPSPWSDFEREVRFPGRTTPLYGYFETVDGQPFCQKAEKLIGEAEKQFERLLWEFESGNRALYVADTAFLRDSKGNPKLPDKRLYRLLCTGKDDLFCDYSPILRQKDIQEGLNCILQRIEDCLALSRGTLSDINHTARTATELKMARHRTYATVKGLQRKLKDAVLSLLQASRDILAVYGLAEAGKTRATFDFDDAVLVGKTDEIADLLALIDRKVLTPEEVKNYLYGGDLKERGGE